MFDKIKAFFHNADVVKFAQFFGLCFYILGFFGSLGWLIYSHAWAILVGFLVVAGFSIPTLIRVVKEFLG